MSVSECLSAIQHDHSDIRTMLEVLESVAGRITRAERVDPQMIDGLARFFDEFVACHDAKERRLLVPAIGAVCGDEDRPALRSSQWQSSRAGRLRKNLVRLLRSGTSGLDAPLRLGPAVAEYAAHLRAGLREEERWYARVLPALTPEDDARMTEDFRRLERQRIGPTGREWFTQLVADYRDIVATWGAGPRPG